MAGGTKLRAVPERAVSRQLPICRVLGNLKSMWTCAFHKWDCLPATIELETWKTNSTWASTKFCSTEKPLPHYIVRQ